MRKAKIKDLKEIIKITNDIVKELNSAGNFQWNENYPTIEDFKRDIEKGELYVVELDGKVAGFACLNSDESKEYSDLKWSEKGPAIVIHRLGVAQSQRGRGIASIIMDFAEKLSIQKGLSYLKVDTSSQNKKMNSLIRKFGFKYIGTVQFEGVEGFFNCYDKITSTQKTAVDTLSCNMLK